RCRRQPAPGRGHPRARPAPRHARLAALHSPGGRPAHAVGFGHRGIGSSPRGSLRARGVTHAGPWTHLRAWQREMSDVFDEIFARFTPERLLRDPRATGEGVSVCVIDSGVERSLLEEKFRKRGQEIKPIQGGIFSPDGPEPLPYEGKQSTPHGTTVADI